MVNTKANFSRLWDKAVVIAEEFNPRMKSVLVNHSGKKEYICRKLGIIGQSDLKRLADDWKRKASK